MNLRIFLALAAGLLMVTNVYAKDETGPEVDVSNFDIAGLKTGMDFDEAMKITAKHFNVSSTAIRVIKEGREHPVTHAKLPLGFDYNTDKISLQVLFNIRVPLDKSRPLALSKISYKIPSTDQNIEAMRKAALDKYGTPTKEEYKNKFAWCILSKPENFPKHAWPCDYGFPVLKSGEASLILEDWRWEKALNQLKNDQMTTKPNF
jgi:hypothetical protein